MRRFSLTLLAALCAAPAMAAAPAPAGKLTKDDPAWLSQCAKQAEANGEGSTLGWGHCMVEHRQALEAAQGALVARIGKALAGKGPEGTDYKAAAAQFSQAQQHWSAFVAADCGIVDNVFGDGTAQGLAGEECVIARYVARNEQLRALEADYFSN